MNSYQKIQKPKITEQPREKLIKRGVKALTDSELISVVLGSGIKGKSVFHLSQELTTLFQMTGQNINFQQLAQVSGIGTAKSCQLMAAIEFSRRLFQNDEIKIQESRDVYQLMKEITMKKQEHFYVLTIDGAGVLINKHLVFIGTLNQSMIHPREIFYQAITDCAAAVILVHNHPSGNLNPSQEDIAVTKRLIKSADLLGIEIIDHIIVSSKGYYSFYNKNLMEK
ncbi:MAG: DNA repair protein RadC [Spirochaetes bacterium]|nr:DNA repair protein RadC [Spirochaetota bacterium]